MALFQSTDDKEGRAHEQTTSEAALVIAARPPGTKRKWLIGVIAISLLLLIVWMSVTRKGQQESSFALSNLLKAAEQGDAGSQSELAEAYRWGLGVQQNDVEAAKWFRKAAERGNAEAGYTLGSMYERGEGVKQDYVEATKWYRKAADQGNALAQNNLGVIYDQRVLQNYAEATKWYRKAADQGDAAAQFNLGVMYDKGKGVTQDSVQALMWFTLSAAGSKGEEQAEAAKFRDSISKKMTPQQIAEAQRLAREWKPKPAE